MSQEMSVGGKKIKIDSNGDIWVNGSSTGLKAWKGDPRRWMTKAGNEITEAKGMSLEQILKFKGFI